jgi:transposase
MTMTNRANIKHDSIILATLESLVPQDHPVRKLEAAIDWQFIYPLAEPLYSGNGRPSIDPVVLFKMILINYCFGYNSMRKTCREIEVNVAYRWFLGYEISEAGAELFDLVAELSPAVWGQRHIRCDL